MNVSQGSTVAKHAYVRETTPPPNYRFSPLHHQRRRLFLGWYESLTGRWLLQKRTVPARLRVGIFEG